MDALRAAVVSGGLSVPDELLLAVLELETNADPDGNVNERRARLRRLLEDAGTAEQ